MPITYTLRSPTDLEVLFFEELRAPLSEFVASTLHDPTRIREASLLAQRFRKDIVRYGYELTDHGLMVHVVPDIVDTNLDAAHRAMLAMDMEIIRRLTFKPRP